MKKLMVCFPLDLTYEIKKRNGMIYLIFNGPDKNLLLRMEGSLLLALQHILNKISLVKVQVDCEFFKKRKERQLREFAEQVAQQVVESGKDEILELMNPYERRIIHIVVNQFPGITSESLGEGFLKRVKIFPVQTPRK
jgi:spoIIIJ-associated protein